MELLTSSLFNPNFGLFRLTQNNDLYFNPYSSSIHEEHLQLLALAGAALGKAIYEGIVIDARFAGFMLAKFKGRMYNFGKKIVKNF